MTTQDLKLEKDWAMNLEAKAEMKGALIGAGMVFLILIVSLLWHLKKTNPNWKKPKKWNEI